METNGVKRSQHVLLPNKEDAFSVKPVGVSKSVKLSLKDPSTPTRKINLNGNRNSTKIQTNDNMVNVMSAQVVVPNKKEVITLVQKTYSNKRKTKDVDNCNKEIPKKKVILIPVDKSVISNQKVGTHLVKIKEEDIESEISAIEERSLNVNQCVVILPVKQINKNTTPHKHDQPARMIQKFDDKNQIQSMVILPCTPSEAQVKGIRKFYEKDCRKNLNTSEECTNLTYVENPKPLFIKERIIIKPGMLPQKLNDEPSKRTLNKMEKTFLTAQNCLDSVNPPNAQSTPIILANNNPSRSHLISPSKLGRPVFLKQTEEFCKNLGNKSSKTVLAGKSTENISSPTILSSKDSTYTSNISLNQPIVVSNSLRDNVADNLVFRSAGSSCMAQFKEDYSKAAKMIYVGSLFVRANKSPKNYSLTPSHVLSKLTYLKDETKEVDYVSHVKIEPSDDEDFEQVQIKAHILNHECQQCGKCYSNSTEYNRHKCEQSNAVLGSMVDSNVLITKKPKNDAFGIKKEQADYNSDESISEQSDGVHIKAEVEIKEEMIEEEEGEDFDPLEDPLQCDANDDDIDDDEEAFLQNVQDPSAVVQVDLRSSDEYIGIEKFQTFEMSSLKKRTCPKCSKAFTSDKIKSHVRYCKRSDWVKRHRCSQCGKDFATLECLDNHVKMAHLKQKERCNICFVRFLNLQAHKDKYHNLKDVDTCNLCGKVVKYLASHSCPLGLDKSLGSARATSIHCPDCGNSVKGKYLKIHKRSHCVGVKTSTFSNFRTAKNEEVEPIMRQQDRLPLLLTQSNSNNPTYI